jgi:ABC-type cobalamin transport system ATPase subunit
MPQQALAAADDVLIMRPSGESIFGAVKDVLTEANLALAYGTEVRRVEFTRAGRKTEALVTMFLED